MIRGMRTTDRFHPHNIQRKRVFERHLASSDRVRTSSNRAIAIVGRPSIPGSVLTKTLTVGSPQMYTVAVQLLRAWSALVGQVILSLACPVRKRLRKTMVVGEMLRSRLPWTRLDSIIPETVSDQECVRIKALRTQLHNCTLHELATLAAITKWIGPRRALEIGTFDGRSTLAIAANMPDNGVLFTMNLSPEYVMSQIPSPSYDERLALKVESGVRFKETDESRRITQLYCDSTRYDYSTMDECQLIFIDGCHKREAVLTDTRNALAIIDKRRGVILWHDATRYGVKPALEHLRARGLRIYLILGTTLAILVFQDGVEVELQY